MKMPAAGPASRSRPRIAWLVGAALAGALAASTTIAESMIVKSDMKSARAAIEGDAERIALVIDAAARSAHARADGFATSPMLRNAIETDAATVRDIFVNEMAFVPARGEVIELFQIRDGKPVSLVRLP